LRCEKFDKLIYLFLDGRLNQSEEEKLKEHLSQCERCQKKLTLLESVEGRAKKIGIEGPSQQYWDNFANRVRKKILVRKERSPVVRLRKTLENIFTFSHLKVKVAAGVISVVLVFIIGKLYIDYRGQEILPSKTVVKTEEQPQLDIKETEKKEGIKRIESASGKPDQEMKPSHVEEAKEKTIPPEKPVDKDEDLLKKKEVPTPTKIAEEKPVPVYAPPLPIEALTETEKPSEQSIISPEKKRAGAGAEKEAEETLVQEKAGPERGIRKTEKPSEVRKLQEILATQVGFVRNAGTLRVSGYFVNGDSIPVIREADTLIQVDTLNRVIKVWRAYIEKNPTDSLSKEGYLQIATAYYLLAKLSQDTTVISEGSKIIQEYLDQIQDPAIKNKLNDTLEKIKALRKK
jgi:hypothetical protein